VLTISHATDLWSIAFDEDQGAYVRVNELVNGKRRVTPTGGDRLEHLDLAGSILNEPLRIEEGQAAYSPTHLATAPSGTKSAQNATWRTESAVIRLEPRARRAISLSAVSNQKADRLMC